MMMRRAWVIVLLALTLSAPAAAERWIIERGAAEGLSADQAWRLAAAELLLRSDLAELPGLTLLGKPDIKSDVATLEMNRLSAAQDAQRVKLGKFARSRAILVIDIAGQPTAGAVLRVIDLRESDREATIPPDADAGTLEAQLAAAAERAVSFMGRALTDAERARMHRPTKLSPEALEALAKGVDAPAGAERLLQFRRAAELSPEAPLAWYLVARELHETGKNVEAVSAYRSALKLAEDRADFHYDLANAFFDDKRHDEAAAEYLKAIALDGAHAASHENLARTWRAQGLKDADILVKCREIAAAHPKEPVAHVQAARQFAAMKQYDAAITAFRTASDLSPDDPIIHFDIAHTMEQAGNEGEAFYEYKEAIKLAPNYAKALNNAGFLYEKKGKGQLALYYYQEAVRQAPDYALAWNNLGILYGKRGMHLLEKEAFRKQTELTPDDPVAWFNLGIACHRQKEFAAAIESYKKALALAPDDKLSHWHLALAYESAGTPMLAAAHWKKVLALSPTEDEKRTAEKHLAGE